MKVGPEEPWYLPAILAFVGQEVPEQLGISPAAFARDVITLERRVASEGESFLTKTLPKLCKVLDLALQRRTALSTSAFKKRRGSALPAFLQGLTSRIFTCTGVVRDDPCIHSIRLLRQILLWCKKVEKGFTDESLRVAIDDFKEVDRSLPARKEDLPSNRTLGIAEVLIRNLFGIYLPVSELRPKHGPGAVANGETVVTKRSARHRFTNLESEFHPLKFFFSLRTAVERFHEVFSRVGCEYGLSRTTFVEKDSSGPRIIGLEPAEYMWCQQSLKDWMYAHVEKHPLTRGRVNFTDQTINRRLTSDWSRYDTLDMSKASDRNSLALVEALFSRTGLWRYLQASRTPGTVLPSGEILWYKKFAPMGSAVCFPVEACVFWALAVAVLHNQGMPLLLAIKNVYVYGDDLIVPHGFYAALSREFEAFGLKFNEDKCCISGKFRESCGRDAYDGFDITPIRLRRPYPDGTPPSFIPLIKHVNSLYNHGYRVTSRVLRQTALRHFAQLRKLRLPVSRHPSLPILYWFDESEPSNAVFRMGTDWIWRVKGFGSVPLRAQSHEVTEEQFLLESLIRGGPVGKLINKAVSPEVEWVRAFDRKFQNKLIMKFHAVGYDSGAVHLELSKAA